MLAPARENRIFNKKLPQDCWPPRQATTTALGSCTSTGRRTERAQSLVPLATLQTQVNIPSPPSLGAAGCTLTAAQQHLVPLPTPDPFRCMELAIEANASAGCEPGTRRRRWSWTRGQGGRDPGHAHTCNYLLPL